MELFYNWIDSFKETSIWQSVLSNFGVIDWIAVLMLFCGFAYGLRKGASEIFPKILELLIVIFLTMFFYEKGAMFLTDSIPSMKITIAKPLAFLLVAVISWIPVSWILDQLGKMLTIGLNNILGALLGVVFGCVYSLLFLGFISQFFILIPFRELNKFYDKGNSYSGYIISRIVPTVYDTLNIPTKWFTGMNEESETTESGETQKNIGDLQ